jgi:hypothetical protein
VTLDVFLKAIAWEEGSEKEKKIRNKWQRQCDDATHSIRTTLHRQEKIWPPNFQQATFPSELCIWPTLFFSLSIQRDMFHDLYLSLQPSPGKIIKILPLYSLAKWKD